MKPNLFFAACAIVLCSMDIRGVSAQALFSTNREAYSDILLGKQDFDSFSLSSFPGLLTGARLPTDGVIIGTRFEGQVSILSKNFGKTIGRNVGLPLNPLKESIERARFSRLRLINIDQTETDGVIASMVRDMTDHMRSRRDEMVGFGALVFKFSNRQFVFGFDVLPIGPLKNSPLSLRLNCYNVDGESVFPSVKIREKGTYTFVTKELSRDVKGCEIINLGRAGYALDNIVFELPLLLG